MLGFLWSLYKDKNSKKNAPSVEKSTAEIFLPPLFESSVLKEEKQGVINVNLDLNQYKWSKRESLLFKGNFDFYKKADVKVELSYSKDGLEINSHMELDEFCYISLFENNLNFSKSPSNMTDRKISTDYLYKLLFNGEKSDSLSIQLYMIFYSENQRSQTEILSLNEEKMIKLVENVDTYRLILRVSGSGKVKINDITMSKQKIIANLGFNDLRKIGFDKPKKLKDLKVAAICDEFTEVCLKYECDLITFEPNEWKASFEFNKPHILFVESAWFGKNGSWRGKVAYVNETNTLQLDEILEWCKAYDIPTVFWNKEDPVHFNAYIKTAVKFDYIFTTDSNSVEEYLKHVNHSNVYTLPFAAQPQIHNPIYKFKRIDKSCFAGSYYAENFYERQNDMNQLLKAAQNFGLVIYDRNYGRGLKQYSFPNQFSENILGKLNADEIDVAYKGYKVSLNVNSVVNSETMCSRRVFECLASYTPVVSTYSRAIENLLPNLVQMGKNEVEYNKVLSDLFENEDFYNRIAHLGYRYVMENHTFGQRLEYILEKVNVNIEAESSKVTIWSLIKDINECEIILANYKKQKYQYKELLLICENKDCYTSISNLNSNQIKVIAINEFLEQTYLDGEIYSYMNPENFYGENYIADLMLATKYTNAEVIGKKTYYEVKESIVLNCEKEYLNQYTSSLDLDTSLIIQNRKFKLKREELIELTKKNNLKSLTKYGVKFYSTDKYNFIKNYRDSNLNSQDIKSYFL